MPNTEKSNPGTVLMLTAVFVDAFCRRNLSLEEFQTIDDMFNILLSAELSRTEKVAILNDIIRVVPQTVTRAPSLQQAFAKGPASSFASKASSLIANQVSVATQIVPDLPKKNSLLKRKDTSK